MADFVRTLRDSEITARSRLSGETEPVSRNDSVEMHMSKSLCLQSLEGRQNRLSSHWDELFVVIGVDVGQRPAASYRVEGRDRFGW